ncbi:MAG: maleylpyruvate isomerase family mycothiol-dependent enzyme [Chloroflexi bacterium]|nr:maleylpyruvate isomerase family mycothiol-dependent enzyme [Chloroflexota bacterium]
MKPIEHLIAERQELLDLCRSLAPAEWETPSLCAGWRVRDVVAHIVGEERDLGEYLRTLTPNRANARAVAKRKGWPTDELIREMETLLRPGFLYRLLPQFGLLDNWVHHQDIRRPLQRPRRHDPERLTLVLNAAWSVKRWSLRGVRLVATDIDWSRGDGLAASGPAEALAMALMGRQSATAELSGPGCGRLGSPGRPVVEP